jgi:hypothetical protein
LSNGQGQQTEELVPLSGDGDVKVHLLDVLDAAHEVSEVVKKRRRTYTWSAVVCLKRGTIVGRRSDSMRRSQR